MRLTLEVICAIDLDDGEVVQLEQGERSRRRRFDDDPVRVARRWEAAGAPRLHVVDLTKTVTGDSGHGDAVRSVIDAVSIPVQVAGGIRDVDAAEAWVAAGADRVVMGTALTEPDTLAEAVGRLGPRLVAAMDVRDGQVRVAGWTRDAGRDAETFAAELAAAGVGRVLCTDIARDGMLDGPNLAVYRDLASTGMAVLASGGIRDADDLDALAAIDGVEGAVVGTAIYTGAIDVASVVAGAR